MHTHTHTHMMSFIYILAVRPVLWTGIMTYALYAMSMHIPPPPLPYAYVLMGYRTLRTAGSSNSGVRRVSFYNDQHLCCVDCSEKVIYCRCIALNYYYPNN